MTDRQTKPRVLVVEDDPIRLETFERWIGQVVRLVPVTSPAAALGLLERTKPEEFAGVMLDYDLEIKRKFAHPPGMANGLAVAKLLAKKVELDTEILVHSMNVLHRDKIVEYLRTAGFSVQLLPYEACTQDWLLPYVKRVHAVHADRSD